MRFEDRSKTFKKAAAEKSLAIQKLKLRQEAEQREKVRIFLSIICLNEFVKVDKTMKF
jgi:hypothetical protein